MSVMQVNPELMRAKIQELTAVLKLKKRFIEAKELENPRRRSLVYSGRTANNAKACADYCEALLDLWLAERDLLLLEVERIKAEIATCERLLLEAKPNPMLVTPQ